VPAALKRLEGLNGQNSSLDTVRSEIAERIAPSDPAGARRLIGLIDEAWRPAAWRRARLRMAARDLPAARALAAEDHHPMVEALLPAVAAQARAGSDPDGARRLLRESVERLGKLGGGPFSAPSAAVALGHLLPLAAGIDPDEAPGDLWLALALRAPLPALTGPTSLTPDLRRQHLELAELAALVARYDRGVAEVVFAPVAARLSAMVDERWGLGGDGPALFRAAGAFDARAAKKLLDALPEDPKPVAGRTGRASDFRHQTKARARITLARVLGLPPALRLREPLMPNDRDDWFEEFEN
jgi:hypothetical protein